MPLVFPDGRLLSPRWRPALWAALAFIPLWVAGYAFIPQSMGSWFRDRPDPYTYPPFDRFFEVLQFLADRFTDSVRELEGYKAELRGKGVPRDSIEGWLAAVREAREARDEPGAESDDEPPILH